MLRKVTPATAILVAASLMFCLVFVLYGSQTAFAQAAPTTPDAPGSISGSVTDEAGTPLPDIEVQLFRFNVDNISPIRILTTDTNGEYRAMVLPAGAYRLRYRDPSGRYAQIHYPDALTLESASSVAVVGNDVADVDVVLRRGGAIEGTLSRADAGYVGYTSIAALTRIDDEWQRVVSVWVDASGVYSLTGLDADVYTVCAYNPYFASGGGPAPSEPSVCYEDIVSAIDYAQPVTVTQGATTTDVDLRLGVEGDGAAIGGVVRSSIGAALPDVSVMLFRRDKLGSINTIAMTTTNAAGEYQFRGLHRGTYFLYFRDMVGPNLAAYYQGSPELTTATPINVDRFDQRLDIDMQLQLGGIVSGRITVSGQAFPDQASIYLLNVYVPPYFYMFPTYDSSTGVYRVAGVPPGVYRVAVMAQLNGMTFSGYYGHTGWVDPELTTTITVTQGSHLGNIDVDLGQGAFDGAISGRVSVDGAAFSGAKVSLYSASNTARPVVEFPTDAEGRYLIGGLTEGSYLVEFSDPLGRYATSFYSSTSTLAWATHLLVSPVTKLQWEDIDAELSPGGAIAGRITLDGNLPAQRYGVQVWYVDNQYPYELQTMTQRSVTDAAGVYRIAGLPSATYRVCAGPIVAGYWTSQGCYGAPLHDVHPYRALNVPVMADLTTQGIDILLAERYPAEVLLPLIAR